MESEIRDIRIERLAYGGEGIGRDSDGRAVFVAGTAKGELVRVEITETHPRFARGKLLTVLEPVAERRTPPCPHFGSCGGCQLQHLTYEAQKEAKAECLRDALNRIGRLEWKEPIPVLSGPEWAYRGRTQFKLERDPETDLVRAGFFAANSHNLCEIETCRLLDPSLNEVLHSLREMSAQVMNRSEGTLDVATDADHKNPLEQKNALSVSHPNWGWPTGPITRRIGKFAYTFDAKCFFQVNLHLFETLVTEALGGDSGRLAVDLYAGVGLFSLPLAERFEKVLAAEESGAAAHYALRNVSQNNIRNVTFSRQSTEGWLAANQKLTNQVDKVLLDPPRSGMSPKALERLIALNPGKITYVSCDPTTLARDLRGICAQGFTLHSVTAIDLFPQTYHIETVAHLSRL